MIKAIFFDWGGVLTEGTHKSGIIKLLKERFDITIDSHVQGKLMDKMDQNKLTFENYVKEINLLFNKNLSIEELLNIYKDAIHHNKEMVEYIKKIKINYKVFILSNNNSTIKSILENYHKELLNLFEKIYFSDELNMFKPNKDIFEYVIKDNNLKAQECIFIDDRQKNIDGANSIGMKGILFTDIEQLKQEL